MESKIMEVTKRLMIQATGRENHPAVLKLIAEEGKFDDIKLASKYIYFMQYACTKVDGAYYCMTPVRIFKEYLAECGIEVTNTLAKPFYPEGYQSLVYFSYLQLKEENRDIFVPETEHLMDKNYKYHPHTSAFNPLGGKLWKSNVIYAVADGNNNSNNIILSDYIYKKTGLRRVRLINLDETKRTKKDEYVAQIRLYLNGENGVEEEGVIRILWDYNKHHYVGFIYEKWEYSCRQHWDAWKRKYKEENNIYRRTSK